jgi:hypothetical protein
MATIETKKDSVAEKTLPVEYINEGLLGPYNIPKRGWYIKRLEKWIRKNNPSLSISPEGFFEPGEIEIPDSKQGVLKILEGRKEIRGEHCHCPGARLGAPCPPADDLGFPAWNGSGAPLLRYGALITLSARYLRDTPDARDWTRFRVYLKGLKEFLDEIPAELNGRTAAASWKAEYDLSLPHREGRLPKFYFEVVSPGGNTLFSQTVEMEMVLKIVAADKNKMIVGGRG